MSCICSVNLKMSCVSHVKVDHAEQVHNLPNSYYSIPCLPFVKAVYVSDPGSQMVMKFSLPGGSCTSFGWEGRYTGPGSMKFAFPAADRVMVFTDHSAISFLKDGTPCESIILDEEVGDAGMWSEDTVIVSVSKTVEEF